MYLKCLFYFEFLVAFNYISDFYIVKIMDVKSAFISPYYFSDIIFKAFERSKFTGVDYNSVANDPDPYIPGNFAFFNIAARYSTNFSDFEYFPYFERCNNLLPDFRHEHTFHS